MRPQAAHAHPPLGGRPRALRHRGVVWSFRGVLQRAANPEPLHRHDGRNAIAAIPPRDARPPRRTGPPATGGDRDKPHSTVAVAAVERLRGNGLAKPCRYNISVTLGPFGRPRSPFWPRARSILKVPVRPSKSRR